MEIVVKAPWHRYDVRQWAAQYSVLGTGEARLVRIKSQSAIDVVVAKITENDFRGSQDSYYISSPNFGVVIPGVPSLLEDHWITKQLLNHDMPATDAVTVAAVLRNMGDF